MKLIINNIYGEIEGKYNYKISIKKDGFIKDDGCFTCHIHFEKDGLNYGDGFMVSTFNLLEIQKEFLQYIQKYEK